MAWLGKRAIRRSLDMEGHVGKTKDTARPSKRKLAFDPLVDGRTSPSRTLMGKQGRRGRRGRVMARDRVRPVAFRQSTSVLIGLRTPEQASMISWRRGRGAE